MNPSHEVEVDGAVLAVAFERGEGIGATPVLFLHAGVADSRMWDAQQPLAAALRPTLRYDRRGFGATRIRRPTPHSPVADLCAVLEAVGVERVDVVGCSQGGRIALDLALAAPGRVASLLLVAPAVTGAPAAELEGPTRRLADAIEAAEAAADVDAVNELEAQLWLDGPAGPAGRIGGSTRALFLDMNGKALRSPSAGDAIEAPAAWPRLEALACPAWVLWGDLDLPQLQSRCETLVERIPAARRRVLPGTAHLPSMEAPDRFNAELLAFLSR
jgi:pimeloyl-ACP methyl ester carboxylesterase